MKLTDAAIRRATPSAKPRKMSAGGGLYLLINPNGTRWWRFDYRFASKRRTLSMGVYPATTVLDARRKCDEARKMLSDGADPGEHRKLQQRTEKLKNKKVALPAQELPPPIRAMAVAPRGKSPLNILGIDDMEECVYRTILTIHIATAKEIAQIIKQPMRRTQRLLDSIESKGLVTHSPVKPRRYIAASPEFAIEALARQRQADIESARALIPDLKEHAMRAAAYPESEQVVEVITNRDALGQIFGQLIQTVEKEAVGFQRAPLLFPNSPLPPMLPSVRIRSISDASYLELPVAWERLRRAIARGEEARTFTALPVKMMIFDRRIGLILNTENPDGPMLLVRPCPLLDALQALFEFVWERSTPIDFSKIGSVSVGKPSLRSSDAAQQMMTMLASGLSDKMIAHQSGISYTTMTRRITQLMKIYDARTRFQLGWRIALEAATRAQPR